MSPCTTISAIHDAAEVARNAADRTPEAPETKALLLAYRFALAR